VSLLHYDPTLIVQNQGMTHVKWKWKSNRSHLYGLSSAFAESARLWEKLLVTSVWCFLSSVTTYIGFEHLQSRVVAASGYTCTRYSITSTFSSRLLIRIIAPRYRMVKCKHVVGRRLMARSVKYFL
jgi:hypothetical protein